MRTFIFALTLLGLLSISSPSTADFVCITPVDKVLAFLKAKDSGMLWVGELKGKEAVKFYDMTKDETSPNMTIDTIMMFQLSTGNDIVLVINEDCVIAHVIVKPNGKDV